MLEPPQCKDQSKEFLDQRSKDRVEILSRVVRWFVSLRSSSPFPISDVNHTTQRALSFTSIADTMQRDAGKTRHACPCCMFLEADIFLPSLPPTEANDNSSTPPLIIDEKVLQEIHSPIVDTHSHAHLERDDEDSGYATANNDTTRRGLSLVSCSVQVKDWDTCLKYASQSNAIVPAIGIHPWYCGSDDLESSSNWLERLETLLQQHPGCLVGEIGLCKMARWVRTHPGGRVEALAIQRRVFLQQLQLAARYKRPVSVHCVQQHAVLIDLLSNTLLPPSIAMHSFTGTAHHVRKLLQLEENNSTQFYFGFSHSINSAMSSSEKSRRQACDAIRAVPRDRLLVESDVHRTGAVLMGTVGAIAYLAQVLEEEDNLDDVAKLTHANGLRFLRL